MRAREGPERGKAGRGRGGGGRARGPDGESIVGATHLRAVGGGRTTWVGLHHGEVRGLGAAPQL